MIHPSDVSVINSNVNKWMRCLAEYKPCLKAFERQIFSLIMNNSKKNTKAICSTKDKKEGELQLCRRAVTGLKGISPPPPLLISAEYVKNISCFTKQTLAELRKVTFKITSAIEYVSGLDDLDEMIPGLCCGIHEVLKMGSDVVDKMCSNQTGQQTTQYFMGMLSSALSDSLDLVCGSYDSISTCQRKKPQVLESLRVKLAEDVSFNYTAIIPMMQVIKKLDSDI